jgi:hypothetical protein
MRRILLRRVVAVLAALTFITTLGLQGMHDIAMAAMKSEAAPTATTKAGPGECAQCEDSGPSAKAQCHLICAPSLAVLAAPEAVPHASMPAVFAPQDVSWNGCVNAPEPHPPNPAAPGL